MIISLSLASRAEKTTISEKRLQKIIGKVTTLVVPDGISKQAIIRLARFYLDDIIAGTGHRYNTAEDELASCIKVTDSTNGVEMFVGITGPNLTKEFDSIGEIHERISFFNFIKGAKVTDFGFNSDRSNETHFEITFAVTFQFADGSTGIHNCSYYPNLGHLDLGVPRSKYSVSPFECARFRGIFSETLASAMDSGFSEDVAEIYLKQRKRGTGYKVSITSKEPLLAQL